jgi:hypothetical protein
VYRPTSYKGENSEHPDNVRVAEQAPVLERDVIDGIYIDQMENVRPANDLISYHLEARMSGRDLKWVNAAARNCGIDSRGSHVIIDGQVRRDRQPECSRYAIVDRDGVFIRWLALVTVDGNKRYFTFNEDLGTWSEKPNDQRLFERPTQSALELPVGYINSHFLYWCRQPWPQHSGDPLQLAPAAAPARQLAS